MNLEEFIVWTYVEIERIYGEIVGEGRLRSRGPSPALSDIEVLTMEIIGEYQGFDSDTGLWRYFRDHWLSWFPALGSFKNFAKHCANLCGLKEEIQNRLFGPQDDGIFVIDGVPMPVCHSARAGRCKVLPEQAAFGYCASKDQKYYGLRGHVVMNQGGWVCAFVLTAANADERDAARDLAERINGRAIADKGFIGADFQRKTAAQGLIFQTPLRKNMKDTRPKSFVRHIMNIRKKGETLIAQLVEQFNLAKVRARNLWHLKNKTIRKLLAYNFAVAFTGSNKIRNT